MTAIYGACINCGDTAGGACDRCARYGAHGDRCRHVRQYVPESTAAYRRRRAYGIIDRAARRARRRYESHTASTCHLCAEALTLVTRLHVIARTEDID